VSDLPGAAVNKLRVTIRLDDGRDVKLPLVQAVALADLMEAFEEPVWHFNDCGCCISLHEHANSHEGFVIGPDGWADWVSDR
jgi:hypothetical protein